jgi:hypothetical protein
MRSETFTAIALVSGLLLSAAGPLPAQRPRHAYVEVLGGLAFKSQYGVSNPDGLQLGLRAGRYFATHGAVRLEADFLSFDAERLLAAPCQPGQVCPPSASNGAGPIRIVNLLASLQYHERASRNGFYLLAGLGPQFVADHPDRTAAIRLAAQAGLGILLDGVGFLEVRYQPTVGARAEPRHMVLVSLGLRWPRESRVSN